ncbi:MAG: 4-hydroxy-tetrahydrodipicolinate reductase [Patescibacteria group bacterium]
MKIAIIGYGKMGKAVANSPRLGSHEISAKIDLSAAGATAAEISAENLNGAEVAIDFTHPDSVVENIRQLAELKIPIVVGTTGWYEKLEEVKKIAAENSVGILYAGNFSVGVQTFYAIVEHAAKLLTGKNFDAAIREIHHTGKADAPSGTAREIAEKVLANFPEKKAIILDNAEQPVPSEKLQISSARIGKVVGVHEVVFDGEHDSIRLEHSGKNRGGYAGGAIAAAEWLVKKSEAGVFTAKDWLGF